MTVLWELTNDSWDGIGLARDVQPEEAAATLTRRCLSNRKYLYVVYIYMCVCIRFEFVYVESIILINIRGRISIRRVSYVYAKHLVDSMIMIINV